MFSTTLLCKNSLNFSHHTSLTNARFYRGPIWHWETVVSIDGTGQGPRCYSKDAIPTIKKTKNSNLQVSDLDNAFDKEEIHQVIHEELGATSMIPPKKGIEKINIGWECNISSVNPNITSEAW